MSKKLGAVEAQRRQLVEGLRGHAFEVEGRRYTAYLEPGGVVLVGLGGGLHMAATPGWEGADGLCFEITNEDGEVLTADEIPLALTGDLDEDRAAWVAAVAPFIAAQAEAQQLKP